MWYSTVLTDGIQSSALGPISFPTSFQPDHHMVQSWLKESRIPHWYSSPTSFLTNFPSVLTGGTQGSALCSKLRLYPQFFLSDHCVTIHCRLLEYRIPHRDLSPASFLTSFQPDHNVLCWLVEYKIPRRALSSASILKFVDLTAV